MELYGMKAEVLHRSDVDSTTAQVNLSKLMAEQPSVVKHNKYVCMESDFYIATIYTGRAAEQDAAGRDCRFNVISKLSSSIEAKFATMSDVWAYVCKEEEPLREATAAGVEFFLCEFDETFHFGGYQR